MEVVLRLLSELRLVLVAIAGICAAAFVFTGLSSLRDMRRAVFRLERSAITGRVIGSWLKAGLCVIIGAVIWVLSGTPTRPLASAATNPLSVTPTPTVLVELPTPVPTADLSQAQAVMTSAPPTDTVLAEAVVTVDPSSPLPAVTATVMIDPITDVTLTAVPLPAALPATALPAVTNAPTAQPQSPAAAPGAAVPITPTAASAQTLPTLPTLPPVPTIVVPTPEPLPTAAPTATAAPAAPEQTFVANCPNPDAQISDPIPGETVTGSYIIRGTAGFNQGKYKIEILRPNIEGWAFLWEGFNQVKGGMLMPNFNSRLFPPGVYTLRLMLVDVAGQETGITCTVMIRIG
jgi:hypothetical protein